MTTEITKQEPRYISVFEDPATFASKIKIADALSRTQFVPEAFRNKPEDCLVALDMASRLDLNPLAIFPDIYVIDNRASFSSKFLIALVNRSGRFSRIRFEEGVDGETEVTFSGWGDARGQRKTWKEKIPNCWARASFQELSSGETYTSPKIDMKFAEKNGWVQKNGSKWQTMPQIMCRYRAASILIKSVCPEIVMGLDWAEDLQDARDDRPVSVVDKRAETLSLAIDQAQSQEELTSVGRMIAATQVPKSELNALRTKFKKRADELKEKLATADDMNAVRDEIEIATTTGEINSEEYGELIDEWHKQNGTVEAEIVDEPDPEPDGTPEQLKWGRQMCETIKECKSVDLVKANLASAYEWIASGYITPAIYSKIEAYANTIMERMK